MYGNHKGAIKKLDILESKLITELKNSYILPIPLGMVVNNLGNLMALMNIVEQIKIN